MVIALSIILLVVSVVLIVSVLFQSGKQKKLSGAIAGGADTFFGKSKENSRNTILNRITTIASIVFVIIVLVFYVYTTEGGYTGKYDKSSTSTESAQTTQVDAE